MYLVTDRLKVRRMCDEDFPDFLSYGMEPERCRMMGTDLLPDEETAYRAFEWLLRHEKRFYALELRSTGHVIGHLTVYNFPSVSSLPLLHRGRGLREQRVPGLQRPLPGAAPQAGVPVPHLRAGGAGVRHCNGDRDYTLPA